MVHESTTRQKQDRKINETAPRGAGLQGNITNHSIHKTSISRLMDAEVPVNYVAHPNGHKNLKSLDSYKAASIEHQRKMSYMLSRCGEQSMQSSTTSSLVQESNSHPLNLSQAAVNPNDPFAVSSGACIGKIEGCSFTFNIHHEAKKKPKVHEAQKEKNHDKR